MVNFTKRALILILSLVVFVLNPIVSAEKKLVFDDAMLFTEDEIVKLEEEANNLSNDYNMDIVIVTTDDADGKTSREYADDYFDYGDFGVGDNNDGILFLIDMDNSEAYISTSGNGIRYLTDVRIEKVLDDVFDNGLTDGKYYNAAEAFLNSAEKFLNEGIPKGQYNAPASKENSLTTAEGIIGAVASGTLGLGFFSNIKRKYKTKPRARVFEYRNNSIINLGITEDNLINSYVTTRIIPVASKPSGSSSSGRSTTHHSSSGRTHGGGGRKF